MLRTYGSQRARRREASDHFVTVLADLDAFRQEHHHSGEIEAKVEGDRVKEIDAARPPGRDHIERQLWA